MNKLYLLLLCCVVLFKANSQPGSLDHTFGSKGIQTTAIFSDANVLNELGRAVLTNANGDVFIAVSVSDQRSNYTRIAKYLPDGRLDSSYGNAGYSDAVKLDVSCAAFQGDKIIVAGAGNFYNSDFILARYTADGVLDSSFGVNGRVKTDFNGSDDYVNAIALRGDKIIAAGYTVSVTNPGFNYNFALARYTTDGTLDSSFGVNGRVITDCNSYYDQANAIALQGEKIIVGGTALVRYTADGRLDSTFGVNGIIPLIFV